MHAPVASPAHAPPPPLRREASITAGPPAKAAPQRLAMSTSRPAPRPLPQVSFSGVTVFQGSEFPTENEDILHVSAVQFSFFDF